MRNRVTGRQSAPLPSVRQLSSAALVVVGAGLAACTTGPDFAAAPSAPATVSLASINAPAVAVDVTVLPGNWGLASYRDEKDKTRTIAEAKSACGNPYVIGAGSQGGVVMHLADQPNPSEVFIKVTADGKSFIGPRGPVGMRQDRVVLGFDNNNVLITEWLDPSVRERYGTMVFVRCGGKAKA